MIMLNTYIDVSDMVEWGLGSVNLSLSENVEQGKETVSVPVISKSNIKGKVTGCRMVGI